MKTLLSIVGMCGVALAAGILLMNNHHQKPTQTEESGTQRSVQLRWHKGTAQQYALRTESSMNMSGIQGGQPTHVQMQAVLNALTLDTAPAGALVGMQLRAVQVSINGHRDVDSEAGLSAPFRVSFSSHGVPTAFEYSAAVTR